MEGALFLTARFFKGLIVITNHDGVGGKFDQPLEQAWF
jgi:hypothetical protein